uniref:RING-type E3 ubiquitin transferase n=1 Tax=Prolemur simus TaxID=1328070 RepID=A0A8C8ZK95_PROSS
MPPVLSVHFFLSITLLVPLGSLPSGEEGEAPPPAPASEGRRRSHQVCLRGYCPPRLRFWTVRSLPGAPQRRQLPREAAKELKMDHSSPRAGTSTPQQMVAPDAPPDSRCPICWFRIDNPSYLNSCLHKYCLHCIQVWSQFNAECPVCKQPFDFIFPSVRADDDFREKVLGPSYDSSAVPGHRSPTAGTREQNVSVPGGTTDRTAAAPPDTGVLFEVSGSSTRETNVAIPESLSQSAIARPTSAHDTSLPTVQEQDVITFRRALYHAGAQVRSVEGGGHYRDISAEFFRRNPAALSRLVPWVRQELRVLLGACESSVDIVQNIIMTNVTRYDLDSQAFMSALRPFLFNLTDHFVHEFISFARSPIRMLVFDQQANYDDPAPSNEEGSHFDSSIITISSDESESQELDTDVATVSQAPWDDETPGPSHTISEQVHVAMSVNASDGSDEELVTRGAMSPLQKVQSAEDLNSSSDDCVFLGIVKPRAERNPEVVELFSESEELSIKEEMETAETQAQDQPSSYGDSDLRRGSSLLSLLATHRQRIEGHPDSSKGGEELSMSSLPRVLSSSWSGQRVDSQYSHTCGKRGTSRTLPSSSQSRSAYNDNNPRKHPGKKRMKTKRSRSRESSPRGRRDKKRSRTRDSTCYSSSQMLSLSSESTSRSPSHSRSYSEGRARSRSGDRHHLKNDYASRYRWDRDDYESSYSRRALYRAHYSRRSSSPDSGILACFGGNNCREKTNPSERKYCYDERHRSRSLSSHVSTTSFSGSRHLQGTNEVAQAAHQFSHIVKHIHYPKFSSELDETYKNDSDSFSDTLSSDADTKGKRRKRARRPSVEIAYEGKATDTATHHTKKKKKHQGDSTSQSPAVIIIDSDSYDNNGNNVIYYKKLCRVKMASQTSPLSLWSVCSPQNVGEPRAVASLLCSLEQGRDCVAITPEHSCHRQDGNMSRAGFDSCFQAF